METIEQSVLLVHFVPSCADKQQSDEQVSKNLFGPPLESAFDHEDFTGDGGVRASGGIGCGQWEDGSGKCKGEGGLGWREGEFCFEMC